MEILISCQNLGKEFAGKSLFKDLSFGIFRGERLGVIGPNGSGKSTLIKICAGLESPDHGIVAPKRNLAIGFVAQETNFDADVSIQAVLEDALKGDHLSDAETERRIRETLRGMLFPDFNAQASSLSGGWRKRLAIARALVTQPDVLFLDEPTNHLDFEGISWLEAVVERGSFASVVVTHDRYFLDRVSSRIIEVNRIYPEGLLNVEGDYAEFLQRKADLLAATESQHSSMANRLRTEEEWLRKGPKARTTKSQSRIDAALELRADVGEMAARQTTRSVNIGFSATGRETRKLGDVKGLSKSMGQRLLFKGLDLVLGKGERFGILGLNGTGKTTFLRLLTGEIEPDAGSITFADGVKVVYFDQTRSKLNLSVTLRRALAPHGDGVIYRGRSIHVASWAKNFAFSTEQLDSPLSKLSGGEQARVLVSQLMLLEADILLLDEPTNDLDLPTLESLEESLLTFPGVVVLVTHDRYMLDRVSTRLLGFGGDGKVEFFSDYSQWETNYLKRQISGPVAKSARSAPAAEVKSIQPKKLSYNEQREWDLMEGSIEKAEERLAAATTAIERPGISLDSQKLQQASSELESAQKEVERLYQRWAELEGKIKGQSSP